MKTKSQKIWKQEGLLCGGSIAEQNSHLWWQSETVNTRAYVTHFHCVLNPPTPHNSSCVWYSVKVVQRLLTKINCPTLVIKLALPTHYNVLGVAILYINFLNSSTLLTVIWELRQNYSLSKCSHFNLYVDNIYISGKLGGRRVEGGLGGGGIHQHHRLQVGEGLTQDLGPGTLNQGPWTQNLGPRTRAWDKLTQDLWDPGLERTLMSWSPTRKQRGTSPSITSAITICNRPSCHVDWKHAMMGGW